MLTSSGSNASVTSNVTTSLPTATAKLLHIFAFLVGGKKNEMDRKSNIKQDITFLDYVYLPHKKID